ncbi:hypothetical protein SELMODRAFT_119500 [Selaginella moellendorffii]|uniref:Uncharacterized protein SmCNGC3_2 n=1 Tax=Selaginella moellendorffii TaxID=88036 RepID=D8SKU8_SELML|nr:hypothetical protein SELMODRAFT_119500 [Selaginella moellendorffii]
MEASDFKLDDRLPNSKVLDPRSNFVHQWNKFFVVSCWIAVFVDPLFFYLPVVSNSICVRIETDLAIAVTLLRTLTDLFYILHMVLEFRMGFIAPSSQVFGKGELVVDTKQIAMKYLTRNFWLDLVAVLPLPQFIIWILIPVLKSTPAASTKTALRFVVFFQYLPRLLRIYPLTMKMVKSTGMVLETPWAGAAYNLILFMLASHVLGATWYLLAVERQDTCWRRECRRDTTFGIHLCKRFLDCQSRTNGLSGQRRQWANSTDISQRCSADQDSFNFGIYNEALKNGITTNTAFFKKYFYCLWWGLRNLSALGQNLETSTFVWEILFAIVIAILGLVLFALLIGNMQTYLQSVTVRLEQMRLKRRDTEQWMSHRQLPPELRDRVRRYDQQKWVATRGVDEEALVQSLPVDLKRDIKRHLCLNLVRRVPLFSQMDERLLDAMCERLTSALHTEGTFITREGDPVNEMLFIIRGNLESVTTDGGRTGFLNVSILGPGDFCGEELLSWALLPKPKNLPTSTRTVKALKEVEGFSFKAEDLRFVAGQFRRMHSKQLQHTIRYYSQQWRTWAAQYIQAAWRRHVKKQDQKRQLELLASLIDDGGAPLKTSTSISFGAALFASKFAVNAMRGVQRLRSSRATARLLYKPSEPDFMTDYEE